MTAAIARIVYRRFLQTVFNDIYRIRG